jgi:hypothetical protein
MVRPQAFTARLRASRYSSPAPEATPPGVITSWGFGQPREVVKPTIGTGPWLAISFAAGAPHV